MALRTILEDRDPALHKVCRPVTKFDEKLCSLLDDFSGHGMEHSWDCHRKKEEPKK